MIHAVLQPCHSDSAADPFYHLGTSCTPEQHWETGKEFTIAVDWIATFAFMRIFHSVLTQKGYHSVLFQFRVKVQLRYGRLYNYCITVQHTEHILFCQSSFLRIIH